ncbi:MAG TPA: DcaP family trimeric outer membrane transporter [Vicinamibacterales bacterium]|nr:DcaP family trimeric outer membrane transporter [Vicinamibacterales bacterium]
MGKSTYQLILVTLLLVGSASRLHAQDPSQAQQTKPSAEVYGFAMLDIGENFRTIDPNWFDTMRVTKLPSSPGQFGENYSTFAGVRQTRFGFKTGIPNTDFGDITTIFEFELFGVGVDEGQTTFRLRHAWGEIGDIGAGQYWSPFVDTDAFPNSLEYWGPTGLVWFRNVQLRWTPIHGDTNFMVALERPGATGDPGVLANRIELQNVTGRFPLPDLTAAYRWGRKWGYLRAAGALRRMNWDDTLADPFDLSGHATGWGINLSSNIKVAKDVVRLAYVFGEGIQNYMNDSPVDVGIKRNPGNPVTPVVGEALGIQGLSAFVDHVWNDHYSSAIGYSWQTNDNSDGQAPSAFKAGHYALGNLLYTPVAGVMFGGEFQWGRRVNFSDGFSYDGYKLQFSFKYNFSQKFGG